MIENSAVVMALLDVRDFRSATWLPYPDWYHVVHHSSEVFFWS